ncbi:Uncharacterized protein Adt_18669 [Abeliophyllum distichum]|uniref:Uncharacterized protein n=1 Tax=Abeliophyllum distichum TaxID=126358 RepID=A0ABD1TK71_9LAMI
MLMRKSITEFSSSTSLHINKPQHAFEPLFRKNSSANLAFKNHKNCKLSAQRLNNTRLVAKNVKLKRNLVVCSSVEPGPPTPSGPPSSPLSWILGIVIAIVIPFIGQKWAPLLKNKFETALNKVEDVVETVEEVAKNVEKVAEDIADDLPAGGQLRKAVDFIENWAERTARDADLVDDFIDKVQGEEEKVEESKVEEKDEDKDKEPAQKVTESETKK